MDDSTEILSEQAGQRKWWWWWLRQRHGDADDANDDGDADADDDDDADGAGAGAAGAGADGDGDGDGDGDELTAPLHRVVLSSVHDVSKHSKHGRASTGLLARLAWADWLGPIHGEFQHGSISIVWT